MHKYRVLHLEVSANERGDSTASNEYLTQCRPSYYVHRTTVAVPSALQFPLVLFARSCLNSKCKDWSRLKRLDLNMIELINSFLISIRP